jgi:hypothetical protein
LNARSIGCPSHYSAQSIQLAHDGSLRNSAYGRIAGQLANSLEVLGKQQSPSTTPAGQRRSFSPGVATANDDYIVPVHSGNLFGRGLQEEAGVGQCDADTLRNLTQTTDPGNIAQGHYQVLVLASNSELGALVYVFLL